MTIIHIDAIHKHYPGQASPALANVSLEIASGESVALFGPSGSGKSTLLKIIAGIETSNRGDILFDNKSILSVAPHRRGAVLMFQKPYLFPFLNVTANIGFGLKLKHVGQNEITRRVQQMLEVVGLLHAAQMMPSQLSGGQQQRVALARALITQPSVLMLDEPLSSLDSAVRIELQEVIRRIQHELSITMILVTHDLTEALSMSDRIAILLAGQVEAYGAPQDIYAHPPTRLAAQAVGVRTFLSGEQIGNSLHTQIGTLQVQINDRASAKTHRPAIFAIRPEHLRLQSLSAKNAIPVRVQDCIHRGEYQEYLVESQGQTFRARSEHSDYEIGETLWLVFPEAHLFEVSDSKV